MNQDQPFDKNHREYVPISNVYTGHLITGMVLAGLSGICYWVASLIFPILRIDFQTLAVFLVLLTVVSELIVVLIQRPFVIKARKGSPGGKLYALPEILVTPILACVGALFIFHEIAIALAMGIIFLVINGGVAAWAKPWEPGLTREDVREKYEETKQMIHQEYLDEKYKDVEVDPSHRELFKKR